VRRAYAASLGNPRMVAVVTAAGIENLTVTRVGAPQRFLPNATTTP